MNDTTQIDVNMPLEERVKLLTQYLLALRKAQDQTDAALLASLGNLNMQELNVINTIGDNGLCTMGEIAKHVLLSMSSITVIVDKLVKAKFVKRVRSEEDRRIVQGELTPEGKAIYQTQIEYMHTVIHKLLNVLSDDEQKNMLKIFHKFTLVNWM